MIFSDNTSAMDHKEAYEMIPLPIIFIDLSGRILHKNQYAQEALQTNTHASYETLYDYIHPKDREAFQQMLELPHRKKPQQILIRSVHLENKLKWIDTKVQPIHIPGEESCFLVTLHDITSRKNRESLLHIKQRTARKIVNGKLFKTILSELSMEIEELLDCGVHCSVLLYDEIRQNLVMQAAPTLPASFIQAINCLQIGSSVGSCGASIARNDIVICSNIQEDHELWSGPQRKIALDHHIHASWSAPIKIDHQPVGTFSMYYEHPYEPDEFELEVIDTCSYLVSLAVERDKSKLFLDELVEKRFKTLINSMTDLVIVEDQEGNWLDVNHSLETLLRMEQQFYKGKTNEELSALYPKYKELLENLTRQNERARVTGEPIQAEYTIEVNGEQYIFDIISSALFSENGDQQGTVIIGRDITSRKEMEMKLAESEQRYKSLVDYHPEGIYMLDLNGRILEINPATEKLSGFTKKEIVKRHFHDFTQPENYRNTTRHFQKALNGETSSYETFVISKSGEKLILIITNVPIVVDGAIKGVFGIAKDVTKKRHMEVELMETKEILESFFENTSDTIALAKKDGTILRVNEAFQHVYGWTKDEIVGQNIALLQGDKNYELVTFINELETGAVINGYETTRYRKDGSSFDASITMSPIRDESGKAVGFSATTRDITARKKTEDILRKSKQLALIGQLAAGVAHEIRNPLTSLKGFLQLLNEQGEPFPFYHIMLEELSRIEFITNEFLALARPQAVIFEKKDAIKIIKSIVAVAEIEGVLTNVHIHTDFQVQSAPIYADENQLKQVFLNIIKNSIESMESGGTVTIQLAQHHNRVHIIFIDEGVGISPERIKHLGEPFYSTKEKGTGLGLMISQKILKEHHGDMTIKSKLHIGTKVEITLPLHS
ncbi:PAS domain S-box protein [Priestia koreensis]|uniref:PAS domain S-box protein n=1 Tax=Priestia koreensis TaxID=284581 RepID=UPI001F583AE7|nr:PAS domain S-box protein [Priestia koreensis]UNL86251.1 PAS domain S-box protein [Priestia koreensis]